MGSIERGRRESNRNEIELKKMKSNLNHFWSKIGEFANYKIGTKFGKV